MTTFGADRVQPQAEFVFDADRPFARIATGRRKLLVIEASRGVFYLPGNEPQRGEFSGDVVVSMYESPDGSAVDPSNPSHLQLRAYLDEQTTFDRDLGQLRSDGPVHVTGPTFDFKGTGLTALYNQSFERIDKLTIRKGEHLRFARHGVGTASSSDTQPVEAAVDTPLVADTATTLSAPTVSNVPAAPVQAPSPVQADAPLYYRADFTQDVFVVAGPDEGTLAGQTLSVYFTADAVDAGRPTASTQRAISLTAPYAALSAGNTRTTMVACTNRRVDTSRDRQGAGHAAEMLGIHASGARARPRSLTVAARITPKDNDVATCSKQADVPLGVVAGTRLISSDARAQRSLMSPGDDDIVVTWSGPLVLEPVASLPALLAGASSESQLLTMRGSAGQPVRGQSGANDRFTAEHVEYLTEPRKLRAVGGDASPLTFQSLEHGTATGQTLDADLNSGSVLLTGPGRLEGTSDQPFSIAFRDRMRLALEPGDTPLLREAEFVGNVEALGPSDRDTPEVRDAKLAAQRLLITLKPDARDASRSVPESLRMEGDARAEQPGRSIQAQSVFAVFAPRPAEDEQSDTKEGNDASLLLSRVEAEGRVFVRSALDESSDASASSTDEPVMVTLQGDRLLALPMENKLDLVGSDADHAVLQHPQATLTGRQLHLTDQPQTLRVPGPGTLLAPLDEQQPDSRLTLAWDESFTYDGNTRVALARGGVEATTSSPTDDTTLGCDELELLMLPDGEQQAGDVALERAHARMVGEQADRRVNFTAQSFDAQQSGTPLTRLTLYGPELIFTNRGAMQTVVVPGAGELLAEDYRPADDAGINEPSQVAMTGRGVTLMQWADRMTLDLLANDMTAEGRLFINHDPLDGQGRVQLYGQRLTADLLETGGLGAWAGGEAPAPQVRTVTVSRDVVITHQGIRIDADTLRYIGPDQKVLLLADEGRRVTVVDPKSRAPQSSDAFTWDLARNRLSATRTTGGTVPME